MPTPLQILLDPISLALLGIYGALILLEALFPARPLPRVKGWRTRALVVFTLYFYASNYLPLLWRDIARNDFDQSVKTSPSGEAHG